MIPVPCAGDNGGLYWRPHVTALPHEVMDRGLGAAVRACAVARPAAPIAPWLAIAAVLSYSAPMRGLYAGKVGYGTQVAACRRG